MARKKVSKPAPTSPLPTTVGELLPTITASQCKIRKTRWLIPGILPRAAVAVMEGRKGLGKSHLCAAFAGAVTSGPPLPGSRRKAHGQVLWANGEESLEEDLIPKLRSARADLDKVRVLKAPEGKQRRRALTLPDEIDQLQATMLANNVALLILDPLRSFVGAHCDLNNEQQAGHLMEQLLHLAEVTSACVLIVRHRRKARVGPTLDHGIGSVAISAVARVVIAVDQGDDGDGWSLLRVIATNKGPATAPRKFRILGDDEGTRIQWGSLVEMDGEQGATYLDDPGAALEGRTAHDLVLSELSQGPRKAKEIQEMAERERISKAAVWRAAKKLGVKPKRVGFASEGFFEWALPPALNGCTR